MIFAFIGLIFTIQSCEKVNTVTKPADSDQISIENIDGILRFSSNLEFFTTLDRLSNLSPDEYSDWENKYSFCSSHTLYEAVLQSLEECTTAEELNNVIFSSQDLVYLSSENEVTPLVDYGIYSKIVNEDGYFYIKDVLHKVTNGYIYITKNGIKAIEEAILLDKPVAGVERHKYFTQVESKGCGSTLSTASETEGDRRAKIYMRVEEAYSYDGYQYTVRDYVSWEIKGFKRVLFVWYSYNTKYMYKDVSYSVQAISHNIYNDSPELDTFTGSSDGPVYSPYDAWSYKWTFQVGETMDGDTPAECPDPYFNSDYAKGTSRGLDYDDFAVISCS